MIGTSIGRTPGRAGGAELGRAGVACRLPCNLVGPPGTCPARRSAPAPAAAAAAAAPPTRLEHAGQHADERGLACRGRVWQRNVLSVAAQHAHSAGQGRPLCRCSSVHTGRGRLGRCVGVAQGGQSTAAGSEAAAAPLRTAACAGQSRARAGCLGRAAAHECSCMQGAQLRAPVPFSPSITMISESVNSPASTCRLTEPMEQA